MENKSFADMMCPRFEYKKESAMSHSFSLSFARDKYIDIYTERHIERVIMTTLLIPFYNKVQGYGSNYTSK